MSMQFVAFVTGLVVSEGKGNDVDTVATMHVFVLYVCLYVRLYLCLCLYVCVCVFLLFTNPYTKKQGQCIIIIIIIIVDNVAKAGI